MVAYIWKEDSISFFFLFGEILGEKHKGARNEQLQPSLSKYASCCSWNSYPYSISLYVRF